MTRLDNRTAQLQAGGVIYTKARQLWKSAAGERRSVREQLTQMAPGIERCMYCGDNLGTDIDHFDPISRSPIKTFEWLNHLLACSFCNSNQKRGGLCKTLITASRRSLFKTSKKQTTRRIK
jgi:hypothetical protein